MNETSYFNSTDIDLKELTLRAEFLCLALGQAGVSTTIPEVAPDGKALIFYAKEYEHGNLMRLHFSAYSQAIGMAAFEGCVLRIIPADDSHDKMKYKFNTIAFSYPGGDANYNYIIDDTRHVAQSFSKFLSTGEDAFTPSPLCME